MRGDLWLAQPNTEARLRAALRLAGDQVVVEAGQLERAAHLGVDDLGADAAFADQHAAFDKILDGPSGGRPGDTQPFGQSHLVLDAGADADLALFDQLLQPRGDLEIERNRARSVHLDRPDRAARRGEIG